MGNIIIINYLYNNHIDLFNSEKQMKLFIS